MSVLRPIKFLLLGLLLAFPVVAGLWKSQGRDSAAEIVTIARTTSVTTPAAIVRMPVEVVSGDGQSRWVYVALESRAVPEPGIFSLAALGGLLLFVRRR